MLANRQLKAPTTMTTRHLACAPIALLLLTCGTTQAQSCPPDSWHRAELQALAARDFAIADDTRRNRLAHALVPCLAAADPVLRDEIAFSGLARWLRAKALPSDTVRSLGRSGLAMLRLEGDAEGFRQPFAALMLSEVARADRLDTVLAEDDLQAFVDAAVVYLGAIRDYRGFDAQAGWRHGVAHAADLVLQLGLNPRLAAAPVQRLLQSLATQVDAAGSHAYVDGEPERLARAVYFIHRRGVLDAAWWDAWFARVGNPAPLSGWAAAQRSRPGLARRHNTLAFVHAVFFAAHSDDSPRNRELAALAQREIRRLMGG
jgi:hypothetical protein